MVKSDPLFSVVIVSFNTEEVLKNCLDSIYKHTVGVTFEVVIVDNASKDGSLKMVKQYQKKHSNLKLVELKTNIGFGAGNNVGVNNSAGKYVLLLNTDTLFTYNILKNIKNKIESKKNLGAYSCKLLNADNSFQSSGGHFPNLFNLTLWQFGIDDIPILGNYIKSFHPKQSNKLYTTKLDWITGAFMVLPKKTFQEAGGFDEKIFMYTEEMELLYRISKQKKSVWYDSTESIIHLGGASGGSYLAITSEVKNIIYFWQKHYPAWQTPLVRVILYLGSLLRLLFFGIIRQNATYRKAYLETLRLSL